MLFSEGICYVPTLFGDGKTIAIKTKFTSQFPAFQLKIVLKSGIKIGSFLNFKDILLSGVRSLLVYKYTCSHCKYDIHW